MKRFPKYLVMIAALCSLGSCRSTTILSAKFESDAVGSLPIKDLPNNPVGDSVKYESVLEPRIRIVAYGDTKALTFTQVNTLGLTAHNQFLSFKGIATSFAKPLWFLFTASHSGSGGDLMIDLSDGFANLIARFYLSANGTLSVVQHLARDERRELGNIHPNESFNFQFYLDMSGGNYRLNVYKSSGDIAVDDLRPFFNPLTYRNPANPMISMRYLDGSSPDRKYVIEDIAITRNEPKK